MSVKVRKRTWQWKGETRTGWQADFRHPVTDKRLRPAVPEEITGKREALKWAEAERDRLKAEADTSVATTATSEPLAGKVEAKPGPVTVADFADVYVASRVGRDRDKTAERKRSALKRLKDVIGTMTLGEAANVGTYDLLAARWRADGLSAGTINNYIGTLTAMLGYASKTGKISAPPKWEKVNDVGSDDEGKIEYLTMPQARALVDAVSVPAVPVVVRVLTICLLDTGTRIGEALALKWTDLDFATGAINIRRTYSAGKDGPPKTKSGIRTVWMTTRLKAALQSLPHVRDHVFVHDEGMRVERRWYADQLTAAAETAGLKDVHPHMLRHTYASHMTIIGVHPARLQKLMGHSSISETERYIHLAPTDTQDAVKQLESARDADAARVAA